MPRFDVPPDIRDLADTRATARRAHDWATADRIKSELERLGWRVIDAASLYDLERAVPPDVEDGGVIRYGAAASVPSRLDEPAAGTASVVLVAGDAAAAEAAARAAGQVHVGSPGAQVIIVANGLWPAGTPALAEPPEGAEVVWLAERLGHAAALNAGVRRAASSVVVLLNPGVAVTGDLAGELAAALDDTTVAVAGPFGLASSDLRRFDPAPMGAVDVVAVDGTAMAFRRADYVARGPLDEHFTTPASLDAWWSLVLRDQGEDDPDDAAPRRAVQAAGALAERRVEAATMDDGGAMERLAKKAFYRVLKRFGTRRDLLLGSDAP